MKPPLSLGFTLIELLITLTVAGILAAIAVPAFNSFLQNDRDLGQINSLVSSFNYARSEAVKRASPNGVAICASPDGLNCNFAATTWTTGWIVKYTDPVVPANTVVLQTVPAPSGTNTVTPISPGPPGGVIFTSTGQTTLLPGQQFIVRVCDVRGAAFARQVEVLSSGRTATTQKPGFQVDGTTALTCP